MSLKPSTSAIYLNNIPSTSASTDGQSASLKVPSSVTIHPSALFSVLDHYLRRKDDQDRVIGTLLGSRSADGSEIEVKSSFAVLHSENEEQVAVDMDYHRTMFELCHKINPKDVIVGWYSTGSTLNTYSALIQNFYSQETSPHHAVHIALDTGLEQGHTSGVKAYVSSPVGVLHKPENCVFMPVPVELRFHETERSGLDILTTAAASSSSTASQPVSDIQLLEKNLHKVMELLDTVLAYVRDVISGKREGNAAVGRYLMDTLGSGTEDIETGGFNSSLQDTLMITYLANLVRSQAELSSRLALVSAAQ